MSTPQKHDEYALNLGKLVSTLQSLEFCLRAFLLEVETHNSGQAQNPTNYQQLKVGDRVVVDAFTNYDNLSNLIEKYNKVLLPVDPKLTISKSLVGIRDALAHGRIASFIPLGNMNLLKFSKPQNNQVEVTYSADLNTVWFKDNIKIALDGIKNVVAAGKRLGMNIFSDP